MYARDRKCKCVTYPLNGICIEQKHGWKARRSLRCKQMPQKHILRLVFIHRGVHLDTYEREQQ